MVYSSLTRPRIAAVAIAVVALAFAACGHSNSTTPTPVATVTAVPTASASAGASSAPCDISLGIAYEPDGGNGGSLTGIQYTHFEDNNQSLCASANTPTTPMVVNFSSSVGGLGFAADASDAVALLKNTSGGYTLAQDIFGTTVGSLTPVGAPYDLSVEPTAIPTGTTASPSATGTPANAPLISDAQSVSILGGSSSAVALTLGVPATGATPAIVALTSLTNAPPQYGDAVPFTGSSYTLTNAPNYFRNIVKVATDTSGNTVALVRGPQDLLSFSISVVATGYQFNLKAEDATLGSYSTLRGSGAIAFDPANSGRALIGGMSTAGTGNMLTLVTGLPNAINKTATIALPNATTITSIAIATTGIYALVGTDVGIFSIDGVNSTTLTIVTPFAASSLSSSASAPAYTTCTGAASTMTNIASIGISSDQKYLVALGSGAGVTCPSGYNDAIVAVPYNPSNGTTPSPAPSPTASAGVTPSAAPTGFTQNNIVAPPTGADLLYVH